MSTPLRTFQVDSLQVKVYRQYTKYLQDNNFRSIE
jgi:hypothetical protein